MVVMILAPKVPCTATYALPEDKRLAGHKPTILGEAACSQQEHTTSAGEELNVNAVCAVLISFF